MNLSSSELADVLGKVRPNLRPDQHAMADAALERVNARPVPLAAVIDVAKATRARPKPQGYRIVLWVGDLPTNTQAAGTGGHWASKYGQASEQVELFAKLGRVLEFLPPLPVTVTLTRIGRKCDSDNAVGALKHCRDGIAQAYGVDDGDERFTWLYGQQTPEKGRSAGVKVEIETRI